MGTLAWMGQACKHYMICGCVCSNQARTADHEEEAGRQAGDGRVHGRGLQGVDRADAHGGHCQLLKRQRQPPDALHTP